MYLRYLCMIPIMLFIYVLSYLFSPFIAALSVILNKNILPAPFHWFYTNDDTLDGGQYQLGWPKVSGISLIKQRAAWICRNPGYGWAAYVFGFLEEGSRVLVNKGDSEFNDPHKFQTWYCEKEAANGKKYFGLRTNIPYFGRHAKLWFGWDMSGPNDGVHNMFKCMFNPFLKD